jgi:alkylation response protein AidB-like acyl-CoA dehydrogenase
MNVVTKPARAQFVWDDPLLLDDVLTEDERMIRDSAREFCQEKLLPRVQEAFRKEHFHREIMSEIGEMGLLGATRRTEYGWRRRRLRRLRARWPARSSASIPAIAAAMSRCSPRSSCTRSIAFGIGRDPQGQVSAQARGPASGSAASA